MEIDDLICELLEEPVTQEDEKMYSKEEAANAIINYIKSDSVNVKIESIEDYEEEITTLRSSIKK